MLQLIHIISYYNIIYYKLYILNIDLSQANQDIVLTKNAIPLKKYQKLFCELPPRRCLTGCVAAIFAKPRNHVVV